jgi:uncharacterized membrane protein (DUF485 family)
MLAAKISANHSYFELRDASISFSSSSNAFVFLTFAAIMLLLLTSAAKAFLSSDVG